MPHAHYGVNKMPDTYVQPFVAYRAWNWTAHGVTSLNGALWTPKQAFEATCGYRNDWKNQMAACATEGQRRFFAKHEHHVPDPSCTCGMYAGINMQHLVDINYIRRGIHGEVSLWGRLMRHTLGWRAQHAYPRNFVVPVNMIPVRVDEAQRRLATLVEFDVDIFLQPECDAKVGQTTIPLWLKDYGYTTQGIEFLVERWKDTKTITHTLAVGDRVAVLGDRGGIAVIQNIDGEEIYYTLFTPNLIYHKPIKSVTWNERNWRWETSGLGSMRKPCQVVS